MARTLTHSLHYDFLWAWSAFLISQIAGISFHGQSDHHIKVVLGSNIQQPARWRRVGADGVETMGRHHREILFYYFRFGVFFTAQSWFEGSIGYPTYIELIFTQFQEFSGYLRTKTWFCMHCALPLRTELSQVSMTRSQHVDFPPIDRLVWGKYPQVG